MTLPLTVDEVLPTTRSVRRRLDFDRPVEPVLIRECLAENFDRVPVMVIPCIEAQLEGILHFDRW